MSIQLARENHYVPKWYQRRFLHTGESQLYYLNLWPDQKLLPDGRNIPRKALHRWGVTSCFSETDLYTTKFGSAFNDDIEKFLFGAIDNRGAHAIRAFADGDMQQMHESFQHFFEYMAAQKLRTPKGLDWIQSRYSGLDQLHLMKEMQALRLMHCTMWTEGVREIVTTGESDVKFILSDHPVTVYNAALDLNSDDCRFPNDPLVDAIGTQTIFPLDSNTCLILTHLEYAQEPEGVILTKRRTHARHLGRGLTRTDSFIRNRTLSRDEVIAVNYLIKSRARRFIAAAKIDWLYPERSFVGDWSKIAKFLLPRDGLWQFGGETYVGFKDGSTHYQDAFGRTSTSHESLKRRFPKKNLAPNDFCGCGSGYKYKKCCKNLSTADRPSWDVYGVRERNLMLYQAVLDILDFKETMTWDDVRRTLSDDQVKQIHQAYGSLWPEDTNLTELLPRPNASKFRGVYLGCTDPRTIEANVIGWLLYFDEVVLAHPFVNPFGVKPEFSPTKSPEKHKVQALKNILLLLKLEPFIRAGFVHLIPDPSDLNPLLGREVRALATQRTADWKPEQKSMELMYALGKDDHRRLMMMLPADQHRRLIRESTPDITDEMVEAIVKHMEFEVAKDPYALLQPSTPGETGAQFLIAKGYSLETALFLATLTGSMIYTDIQAHWQQLLMHSQQKASKPDMKWKSAIAALESTNFPIDLNIQSVMDSRQRGLHANTRQIFCRLAEALRFRQSDNKLNPTEIARQLEDALKQVENGFFKLSNSNYLKGNIQVHIPEKGFSRNEVQRLLLLFGGSASAQPVPIALMIKMASADIDPIDAN